MEKVIIVKFFYKRKIYMKKKRTSRIHVNKVESAREISSTRQISMKVVEIRQREPKASTARPRINTFIPPLQLQTKAISKLEKTPRPESATLRFLTEPTKYSDPNSISTFIQVNAVSQEEQDNAKKIQRIWRKIRDNKKTLSFIRFVFNLYRKRAKFPMHLWLLARRFPADIAKIHYNKVVDYMLSRHYLFKSNNKWVTTNFANYLLTFDQYCKTNCIFIGIQYDIDKIIKFVKIIMRPLIKEAFQIWREMNEKSRMLPKQDHKIRATHEYRSTFNELFWTYVFWRRWTVFRKSRNLERSTMTCKSFYLLEWNIYKAKKQQKINIINRAFSMRNDRLKFYAFSTMRRYCLSKIKKRREYNKIKKVGDKYSMSLAFRSFLFYHVQCSIKKSMKYRVLSSWYKITDKSMIHHSFLSAIQNRMNLKLLIRAMKKWNESIYENSLFLSFLFDSVSNNQLFALKYAFFLMKDFVHFAFVSSFYFWKKLMWMKKRSLMFVSWSFNHSKSDAVKSYLIDIFHENCLHQVDYLDYFPFKSELEKKFTSISKSDSATISLTKKKSKLMKIVQNANQIKDEITVESFVATVDQTLQSYQKVEEYPIHEDKNWIDNASSDQIKTLFYHIVIIKSYINKGKYKSKTKHDQLNQVRSDIVEYRERNNLFTLVNLRKYRKKQEEKFEIKRKLMVQKLHRDALLLAKKDVYLALVAMNEINPQFTIEPEKTFKESNIIREGEFISTSSSSSTTVVLDKEEDIDDLQNMKFSRKQKHPLLNEIRTLKEGITKSNRKVRRHPKQLFTEETNQSAHSRTIRIALEQGSRGSHSKLNDQAIIYEKHQPLSNVNKEKYFLDKKRKEKEQLKNMPPPLDQMPTIKNAPPLRIRHKESSIQLSSHLDITNESLNKFMESQDIDLSHKFSSKSPSKNLSAIGEGLDNDEEEEEEESNENEIDQMISQIEKISFPYINNDSYMEQSSLNRRDILTTRYFSILDVLLSRRLKPKFKSPLLDIKHEEEEEENNEENLNLPQNCVSRVLRYLMPSYQPEKSKKKHRRKSTAADRLMNKRKPLFQDRRAKKFEKVVGEDGVVYSKSSDPQFSNVLFIGDYFMSKINMSGKLPIIEKEDDLFNKPQKNKKKIKKENEDEEEDYEEEDEDDDLSSTFDIPGFHHLLEEVGNYLNYGNSFDLSIDQQEKEMLQNKDELNPSEKVMLVMNKLARNLIKDEASNEENVNNIAVADDLVSVDTTRSQSAVHSSRSTQRQQQEKKVVNKFKLTSHLEFKSKREERMKKIRKRIKRRRKKLNAKSTIVITKKFTFTQDLINSIHEASRLMHPLLLTYYDDVSKIDPFDGMDTLKKNIKMIVNSKNDGSDDYYSYYDSNEINHSKEREKESKRAIQRAYQLTSPHPHQNKSVNSKPQKKNEVFADEFILSIGGKTPRRQPSRVTQKVTVHTNTLRSTLRNDSQIDLLKVENLTFSNKEKNRPVTAWSKVKQEVKLEDKWNNDLTVSNLKFTVNKRPKPHVTKLTATLPSQPPEFSMIHSGDVRKNEVKKSLIKSGLKEVKKLKNPKWIIENDPVISDEDVEFFLFTTPFILPPSLINNAIERQRKK